MNEAAAALQLSSPFARPPVHYQIRRALTFLGSRGILLLLIVSFVRVECLNNAVRYSFVPCTSEFLSSTHAPPPLIFAGNCMVVGLFSASRCSYVNQKSCSGTTGTCSSCFSCSNSSSQLGCQGCVYASCNTDSSTLNIGAIVGGVIAGVAVIAIIVILISLCCSQRYHYSNYYPGWGGGYYPGGQTQMLISNQVQPVPYPVQPVAYPSQQPYYPQGYQQPLPTGYQVTGPHQPGLYPWQQPNAAQPGPQPSPQPYPQQPGSYYPGKIREEEYSQVESIGPSATEAFDHPVKYPNI